MNGGKSRSLAALVMTIRLGTSLAAHVPRCARPSLRTSLAALVMTIRLDTSLAALVMTTFDDQAWHFGQ